MAPTGVERMLYLRFPRSVIAHKLTSYLRCLLKAVEHTPDHVSGGGYLVDGGGGGDGAAAGVAGSGYQPVVLDLDPEAATARRYHDDHDNKRSLRVAGGEGSISPDYSDSDCGTAVSPS